MTGDKLGDWWLGWSRVAHGGSLSFYIPEQADALMRLLTRARPSMVCISAPRPRAKVSQMEVLCLGSLPHHCSFVVAACAAILRGPAIQPRLLWSGRLALAP